MAYEKIAQAKALLAGTGYGVYPVESVEKMRVDLAAPPDYFRPRGGSDNTPVFGDIMHFRPLQDRVLVRRNPPPDRSHGGILLPESARETPAGGEVVAVGGGAIKESGDVRPLDVKPGDRILFGRWSGTEVKIDGEEFLIMKEPDILGIIGQSQPRGGSDEAMKAKSKDAP